MARSCLPLIAWLLLGTPALAQEGASMLVPTVPGMFGIDTCGAFLCGNPATVPNGSKRAVHALEAAFRPRPAQGVLRSAQAASGRVPQVELGSLGPRTPQGPAPEPSSGRPAHALAAKGGTAGPRTAVILVH